MRMITAVPGTVLAVAALAACAAAANPGVPSVPARPSHCITMDVGFRTSTGHEADAPVTACGLGGSAGRTYQCEITSGTFGAPNQRWKCWLP